MILFGRDRAAHQSTVFLFGGLVLSMAILKTEPMTVIAHKFIGSASVRLAL